MPQTKWTISTHTLKATLVAVLLVSVVLILASSYRYEQLKQKVNAFNQSVSQLQPGDDARAVTNQFLQSVGY